MRRFSLTVLIFCLAIAASPPAPAESQLVFGPPPSDIAILQESNVGAAPVPARRTDRLYHRLLDVATRRLVEPALGAPYLSRATEIEDWWDTSDRQREAD